MIRMLQRVGVVLVLCFGLELISFAMVALIHVKIWHSQYYGDSYGLADLMIEGLLPSFIPSLAGSVILSMPAISKRTIRIAVSLLTIFINYFVLWIYVIRDHYGATW